MLQTSDPYDVQAAETPQTLATLVPQTSASAQKPQSTVPPGQPSLAVPHWAPTSAQLLATHPLLLEELVTFEPLPTEPVLVAPPVPEGPEVEEALPPMPPVPLGPVVPVAP